MTHLYWGNADANMTNVIPIEPANAKLTSLKIEKDDLQSE